MVVESVTEYDMKHLWTLRTALMTALLGVPLLAAQEGKAGAPPPPDTRPLLTKLGRVVYSEDLSKEPFDPNSFACIWVIGKWEIKDGILTRSQKVKDNHVAYLYRRNLAYHNAALRVSFRLDGAQRIGMKTQNAGGYVAMLSVTATSTRVHGSGQDRRRISPAPFWDEAMSG